LLGLQPPFLLACSDPTPLLHEHDAPDQVALDYQGIEAGHILVRLNPAQNQGVLDGQGRSTLST
jgi:hypothetical protein